MFTRLLCLFLAYLSFPQSASARIGESLQQCRQRYGNEVNVVKAGDPALFSKSGFDVIVSFTKGVADMIVITKQNEFNLSVLDDQEIETFKAGSGGKLKWELLTASGLANLWRTSGGEMYALYEVIEGRLVIMTAAKKLEVEKKAEEEKRQKLKDF